MLAGKPNVRVLVLGELGAEAGALSWSCAASPAACWCRPRDLADLAESELHHAVTRRQPTAQNSPTCCFAWRVCKFVKSNAIVFARDGATIGIGAGQMSRVYSTRIAAMKAADEKLEVARRRHGLGCLLSVPRRHRRRGRATASAPSSSRAARKRDDEVIAAADEHDMAMVFTGMRHFRH